MVAASPGGKNPGDLQDFPHPPMKCLAILLALGTAVLARPNVVFIITDDLGYGDLSCYGQKHFETPVLDRLAAGGLRFTQHYSGATVCAPSRCTLMTGLDNGRATIRGNGAFALRPDPQDITVAGLLGKSGYRTAMIGKSCVTGNTQDPSQVLSKGFDVFYGTTSHVDGHWRYPRFVYDQEKRVELPGNDLHHGRHYDLDLYTRKAVEFIEAQSNTRPFFLLLSYPLPHASVLARPEQIPGGAGKEPGKAHYTPVADPKAHYAAMVEAIDADVGRVVDALARKNLGENTLILFSSDNGSHSEGGYRPDMLDSNGPLRGAKRDLFDGGIRVPLVAHWPAGIRQPGVSGHLCGFVDFLPTVCELAGIPVPKDLDGVSYASLLKGGEMPPRPRPLYWESHENQGRRAMRDGRWKLVQYQLADRAKGRPGRPMLFNLDDDPGESVDLAEKHPEIVRKMLGWMDRHRQPSEWFPFPALDSPEP